MPHPKVKGGYIAAEGNRRVCALKLLDDPDKAGNELDKNYFRNLKKRLASPISKVLAVTFPDMASARPWVELRHDAPTGVGTKKWDAPEKARFNKSGKGNNPNTLALEAMEYARTQQLISEDDLEKLTITTLTRFLSTPDVRSALGITNNKELKINVPAEQFDSALTKFLMDSADSESVFNSRANAAERKEYAEDFRASGYSPTTRGISPYTPFLEQPITLLEPEPEPELTPVPAPAPEETPQPINAAVKTQRNKRNRELDTHIVPSGFAAPINDPVFQRLFRELRTLDAEEFAFSATYLLRSFIEQLATLFIRKHNIQPMPKNLHDKLGKVAEQLVLQDYKGKGMAVLRKMASDVDSKYSPDTMGNFVHGGAVPTRIYVIKAWDSFEPIAEELIRQLR